MNVSVVVPWRPGCSIRERAWNWVRARYAWEHPDWQLVTGHCSPGPFNRAEAILDGALRSDGDVILVADADVWADSTEALQQAREHGWAIPHLMLHRLSDTSSEAVMAGVDPRGLPLDRSNAWNAEPRKGSETGTLVAVRRDVLFDVPPDVRFVGWGQEDEAWARALRCLVGEPWRGRLDLFHLWHPPQERQSRSIGNPAGKQLADRYLKAIRKPAVMRALIDESKEVWPWASSASSSTT